MTRTPNKNRKSVSLWETCSICEVVFQQKDVDTHKSMCNSEFVDWEWNHNFIKRNVLYSSAEVYDHSDFPKNITEKDAANMVFISTDVMQMCDISLGDPVIISFKHTSTVKLAMPSSSKTLTSVLLLRSSIDLDQLEGHLKLQKLTNQVYNAAEITLKYKGKHKLPPLSEVKLFLKIFNEFKIITFGNKVTFPYYYKTFTFQIVSIKSNEFGRSKKYDIVSQMNNLSLVNNDLTEQIFYKINYATNWKVEEEKSNKSRVRFKYQSDDIGGYEDLINNITGIIGNISRYDDYSNSIISKGILLYGSPGVGKTMIAEAILNQCEEAVIVIKLSALYNKISRELETILMTYFEEAKSLAPSIIYIEDLDTLFQKKNNNDRERNILILLNKFLDEINCSPVAILATTSKLESIDSSLRRPGRLDEELEVAIPNPGTRRQIIDKILMKIDHDLNDEDIAHIAFVTHGFVGVDLYGLCAKAVNNSIISVKNKVSHEKIKVKLEHFIDALKTVSPSAMKEVLVEVCNVKWEDIGGQEELKLKLLQTVEWPLKYPEVFDKMGIAPPRGVLMYGPPGCSKTMIAKALATESKLNFLNIKGSELFSKYVGESEKAVREIFRKARQVAPSIIFIDEIDAIGGERGASDNNVQDRVLTQMLTELDGVTALGNVALVAATNRPDRIDKALLRPGRLDRIIYVPLPDTKTRGEIFKIKLKKMPLSDDVDIETLVERTERYSGAEIQAICQEAALNALEQNLKAEQIGMSNFNVALNIVKPITPDSLIQLYEQYKK